MFIKHKKAQTKKKSTFSTSTNPEKKKHKKTHKKKTKEVKTTKKKPIPPATLDTSRSRDEPMTEPLLVCTSVHMCELRLAV